ncbi:hypothetical protein POREN0001_0984 [Porphyromonas endodontalis ATCC 35406]|uniref:Uncharacterized protein n=1 Tax=Porphyromonas endodontalis (strain ATCC 35406 / DSM 24491 / JCM 8526 / CCUG 16442 / BCRC 14492 / NCTC 13058 / HG 370) TaxID=553175 RepID=C3J944_POREA|nr:hypothetical protein POREN0001_0984 [Porphyromonas endodontalis ATCC 35406]
MLGAAPSDCFEDWQAVNSTTPNSNRERIGFIELKYEFICLYMIMKS